jgi:RNA polymerase sigma-70 factor (ECF subfamily)
LQNTGIENSRLDTEGESLVDRAVRGDTGAFGRLYDIYADRIYRHIYYRTANIEDARDMTQDVFARAWQVLPKYRRTSTPFLGWLFTISHNRVIDYYRTRKDHAYLDIDVTADTRGSSPEEFAEAQFNRYEVRRAVLKLPEDQQRVILLTFIEGMEYPEVAAILNKSEGNIRVIVHRALKKMREILKSEKS